MTQKEALERTIAARATNVVAFLKANSTDCWTIKDEPWMHFVAEVEEYDKTFVRVGYYFESNGDMCFDPNIELVIMGEQLVEASLWHWLTGCQPLDDDLHVASAFLDAVWQRHFQPRLQSKESEDGQRIVHAVESLCKKELAPEEARECLRSHSETQTREDHRRIT